MWYITKTVPLPGSDEPNKNNISFAETQKIQKHEVLANKWIGAGLFISIAVNLLHFIVLNHIGVQHGRIYILLLISILSVTSVVVLCFAAVLDRDFWDILSSEGSLFVDVLS